MKYPVAYIRRSAADAENPGDISRDVQEAAVRELAARDGHNGDLHLFVDWARSADESKEAKRVEFIALLAAIEAGQVSAVYAYSLDRLYRSMRTFVRLTDAAKANGVRIVTLREGVLGGDGSPMAQAFAEITAVFSALELNTVKARARGAMIARRERGDRFGHPPYGFKHIRNETGRIVRVPDETQPLEPILAAVREAGSVLRACQRLEARGIRAPKGGTAWSTSCLTRIVESNAPELLPPRNRAGRRVPSRTALAQLLTCHCGATMTPNGTRGQYYCSRGHRAGPKAHGRYNVSERRLLPLLKAEAARLRVPGDAVARAASVDGRREALAARLQRANELYIEGSIDRTRFEAEKARTREDLDALDAEQAIEELPTAIHWGWPPERLNEVLRSLWRRVVLDEQMRPTFEWTVPAWRA